MTTRHSESTEVIEHPVLNHFTSLFLIAREVFETTHSDRKCTVFIFDTNTAIVFEQFKPLFVDFCVCWSNVLVCTIDSKQKSDAKKVVRIRNVDFCTLGSDNDLKCFINGYHEDMEKNCIVIIDRTASNCFKIVRNLNVFHSIIDCVDIKEKFKRTLTQQIYHTERSPFSNKRTIYFGNSQHHNKDVMMYVSLFNSSDSFTMDSDPRNKSSNDYRLFAKMMDSKFFQDNFERVCNVPI